MTAQDGGSEQVYTDDAGAKGAPPGVLFVGFAAAALGAAAYLWYEVPAQREVAAPLLAGAAGLFALIAAWCFGRRGREPETDTDSRAWGFEQTSAAIAQMDGRLKETANAAAQTVVRADEAIEAVTGGRDVTDRAVQAMTRVSDSAKGIDSVIEGLDKIAFQTRVLAMNAAVEAGRAGEAGRGFAVVADLVSALAMRAEEEAKRARDQLTVTQSEVGTAVEAVQGVDQALVRIVETVGDVHRLLGDMADDNAAQTAAIGEITTAITSMDRSTQQNAAMVEQTSAAARNLLAQVDGLAERAARFHVDEPRVPNQTARRPDPASLPGATFTPSSLPAAAVAAMRAPTRASDDWTEF